MQLRFPTSSMFRCFFSRFIESSGVELCSFEKKSKELLWSRVLQFQNSIKSLSEFVFLFSRVLQLRLTMNTGFELSDLLYLHVFSALFIASSV